MNQLVTKQNFLSVISKIAYFLSGAIVVLLIYFALSLRNKPVEPNPIRRKSPIAIAQTNINDTYIKIVYGQPYKRGRRVFGGLVDYNKIWRTGANETTELTTTGDILINGEKLKAGTYSIFTKPRADKWIIILNDSLGQWGAFTYNRADDVLRTSVPVQSTKQPVEAFTIQFNDPESGETAIQMAWDTVKVVVPVSVINN